MNWIQCGFWQRFGSVWEFIVSIYKEMKVTAINLTTQSTQTSHPQISYYFLVEEKDFH